MEWKNEVAPYVWMAWFLALSPTPEAPLPDGSNRMMDEQMWYIKQNCWEWLKTPGFPPSSTLHCFHGDQPRKIHWQPDHLGEKEQAMWDCAEMATRLIANAAFQYENIEPPQVSPYL